MKLQAFTKHKLFRSALGALLTVLCGLCLWSMTLGARWVNTSYDYLFRFGARSAANNIVSNNLVVILMDNDSYGSYGYDRRDPPWDRFRHAELLNKLADDGCPLVVFDAFFRKRSNAEADRALAHAMSRQRKLLLMAEVANANVSETSSNTPGLTSVRPMLPMDEFLHAARTNWAIAYFEKDKDAIVRRHFPFPADEPRLPTLSWSAAAMAGARLDTHPEYLRYYYNTFSDSPPWTSLPYKFAAAKYSGYFSNKIVFIGNQPATLPLQNPEDDKFGTPYGHWEQQLESVGGVELHATAFLNLINGDWLRRFDGGWDFLILLATGTLLGGGLARLRPLGAFFCAAGAAAVVSIGAICLSYYTNYWFPWLIIAGGQVPCALGLSLIGARFPFEKQAQTRTIVVTLPSPAERPETPDYQVFDVPFGEGAYGKVWLAKNAVGQWQALKTIYLNRLAARSEPYDREFNGIRRYKPISDKHPGLLRVDFVSVKKEAGYFYYVMELGDSMEPDWEKDPRTYRPRDLATVRAESEQKRLPFQEGVRIGVVLADALDFLHKQGLTHRDIKPRNILFVKNQPKLADVGLVADIRPNESEITLVGTPEYMPHHPEPPGTMQADIYALGMVLYVILTGREPKGFPEIGTTLIENIPRQGFIRMNSIILKACEPDRTKRYTTAAEMQDDLAALYQSLKRPATTKVNI